MNALAPITRADYAIEPKPHRFTLNEVVALRRVGVIGEGVRVELLDGEILEMPPEGELHAWFKLELNHFFSHAVGRELRVAIETRIAFAERDAPVPDLHVVPRGIALTDTPGGEILLLVEVADSSLTHDTGRKAAKYAANDVAEYWVLDVRSQRTLVHLRPENGEYIERRAVPFSKPLSPERLEGVTLVIADLPGFDQLSFEPPPA